jgi:hypothetical protein
MDQRNGDHRTNPLNELLIQVDAWPKGWRSFGELQKTGAARDTAMRERDVLTAEKNEL